MIKVDKVSDGEENNRQLLVKEIARIQTLSDR